MLDESCAHKAQTTGDRADVIDNILSRLEALEYLHAKSLGLPSQLIEERTVHPSLPERRYAGTRSDSEVTGLDRFGVGKRPLRAGTCFDERHGDPCPGPCTACDEECDPKAFIPEVAPYQLSYTVQKAFADICPNCRADFEGTPIPERYRVHNIPGTPFYDPKEPTCPLLTGETKCFCLPYGDQTHFSRKIALYNPSADRATQWQCPDCHWVWTRT